MENKKAKPPREEQPSEENKSITKPEQATLENLSSEEKITPDEIIGGIEQMPPEAKKSLQAFMAMYSRVSGPRPNPLFEKFTDAHIDKYLDYVQRDDDHEYELKKTNRWFYLVYAALALLVFIAGVVYLLPRDKELLSQFIQIVVLIAGGIGAGYGLSKRHPE